MATSPESAKPLTGRAVLIATLSFFAAIILVNGVFLTLAISTNTGVVANEPYRKGLKYNERIAADQQQKALDWTSEITVDEQQRRLVALLSDRDGHPISGLMVTADVGRAATNREDIRATLTETVPGRYEVKLPIVGAGNFVANLEVVDPSTADHIVVYRARRRLWLKL